jgi:dihydroorotate dehydrogenase (NAD+) catalytic subunit
MIWQVHQAVSLPILGMGGVQSGRDAAELMLAGATAVAVGTALFRDPCAILAVQDELSRYLEENGYESPPG